jgi:L-malate glycosyltransferase
MRAFRARLLAEHPDVVHAFFNDAAILIPLHCWRTGAIVVTSRRDMGFWYSAFNLPLLRLANRYVDRIVCNSEAVAREVIRRERTRSSKLVVIYNALPANEQPREAAAHVNEPETGTTSTKHAEIRVCLLANLRPIKRMEDFIKAAAMVAEQVPDCRFLIIGESLSPSYEASLRRLAEDLSLQDRLEFTGLISDPQRLLDSCQIGVLTSESEGLSNAILEYMAMGLPVICSNVGGNAELVQHGHNGFLYPCGDAIALADHLRRLCTDAAERRRMGAASRERARSFSTERMVQSHLRAYLRSREHADG